MMYDVAFIVDKGVEIWEMSVLDFFRYSDCRQHLYLTNHTRYSLLYTVHQGRRSYGIDLYSHLRFNSRCRSDPSSHQHSQGG
jgi:hypothetical protein